MADDLNLTELQVDLGEARVVELTPAPVSDPLTGKEKAGVWLTWGIIGVLSFFLLIILVIFVWGEYRFLTGLDQLEHLKDAAPEKLNALTELLAELDSKQKSFRVFWFDTLQLIILNVLFPILTALLGYVFGTTKNNNSSSAE